MGVYLRPERLDQALEALGGQPLDIIAGGTDFYPARVGQPLDQDVLDITAIEDLRGIEDQGEHWRIGALTTWTDLIRADLPPCFDGIKLAAREIGGVQIQNAGTVAGNICNASPAADAVPALLALDARVDLASAKGVRSLRLDEFITGNRQTGRRPDELVVGLSIPKPMDQAASTFLKLGARKYLVISIVMVAAVIEAARGKITRARIAVGACSPVARRLAALESDLVDKPLGAALGQIADPAHFASVISPIDDVRGSAAYREAAAVTLVRRALSELGSILGGGA